MERGGHRSRKCLPSRIKYMFSTSAHSSSKDKLLKTDRRVPLLGAYFGGRRRKEIPRARFQAKFNVDIWLNQPKEYQVLSTRVAIEYFYFPEPYRILVRSWLPLSHLYVEREFAAAPARNLQHVWWCLLVNQSQLRQDMLKAWLRWPKVSLSTVRG